MYKKHFGLSDLPFSIAPDPRFLYMSDQHREALAHLVYGVTTDGGFVLLTGEVGTGKTTVCRCLLEQVPEGTDIAFILNPRVTVEELLASICDELGVRYPEGTASNKVFIDRINAFLLDAHARNRKTVLVIEEAQNLSPEVLEQVRLLTNLETNDRKLLQIIMLGQPELRDMLAKSDLRQLSQRITARYHLGPLSKQEVSAYVTHRLSLAGVREHLFSRPAMQLLCRLSNGVPRLVNLLCDRALLGAYVQDKNVVDRKTLEKAAEEILGKIPVPGIRPPLRWAFVIMLIVSCGAALAVFYEGRSLPIPVTAGKTPAETAPAAPVRKPDTLLRPSGLSLNESRKAAYAVLFSAWGMAAEQTRPAEACRSLEQKGMRCLDTEGNLEMIRRMNKPAVLKLQDDRGQEYYAALIALNTETAVMHVGQEKRQVPMSEISRYWLGDFTVIWKVPADYHGEIRPGDRGPAVRWLAARLASLRDGNPSGKPSGIYDPGLQKQVKRFQLAEGLRPDGIVGPQTVIMLSASSPEGGPSLADGVK